ncbi:MAG: hypothetical protein AAGA22_04760, partial [Pseudomonadota bacterium]
MALTFEASALLAASVYQWPAVFFGRDRIGYDLRTAIGRGVVTDDDFNLAQGLRTQVIERLLQH